MSFISGFCGTNAHNQLLINSLTTVVPDVLLFLQIRKAVMLVRFVFRLIKQCLNWFENRFVEGSVFS